MESLLLEMGFPDAGRGGDSGRVDSSENSPASGTCNLWYVAGFPNQPLVSQPGESGCLDGVAVPSMFVGRLHGRA